MGLTRPEGAPRGGGHALHPCGQGVGDNPQVQRIIVAIPNGGSDKYGVLNPQGAKVKINIL